MLQGFRIFFYKLKLEKPCNSSCRKYRKIPYNFDIALNFGAARGRMPLKCHGALSKEYR